MRSGKWVPASVAVRHKEKANCVPKKEMGEKSRQPLGRRFLGKRGKQTKKRLVVKKFTTRRWDKLDDKGKIRESGRRKSLKDGESTCW
ncbi:hypothetical protein [Pseudoflavonifractor phocaeensis]|uniref:hypothetical protein n=1 Tax=Pseudoflavonifractor phocaeensis TaxID=1870988 RepID=UPI00195D91A8|nr:hypothetical protein [Pseudoflavonifractor phocaeensis]MBM6723738.1 hypothetical protein [Pseudoflavonifractor phocaeensis]